MSDALELISVAERELLELVRSDSVFFLNVMRSEAGGALTVLVGDRCNTSARVEGGQGLTYEEAWKNKQIALPGIDDEQT